MDITQAKAKQTELEAAILKLVSDFELETLMQVTSVTIDRPSGYYYRQGTEERVPASPSRVTTEVRL